MNHAWKGHTMSRRTATPAALAAAYGLGPTRMIGDPYAGFYHKQRVYTVEPVVPERLRAKSELRPHEYIARGWIRSWWGWQGARVTVFVMDFTELYAAFHQIKNMRVERIEQASGGHAISREVKL